MKKRSSRLLLTLFVLLALLPGCAENAVRSKQSAHAFYFDTVINLTIYWKDDKPLQAALKECAYYEQLLSKTVEGSDVWNLNHAQGQWVTVSEITCEIMEKAREYSILSSGRFDVTIAPCAALWDFTNPDRAGLPKADALADAAARVDYTQVEMEENRVRLGAGQTIDLGAIAKGYITDRIADFLKEVGVESGLLNFGGNVQTIGDKPSGEPWSIGIQDPESAQGSPLAAVSATDAAVVTSGIYERGFELEGVRYHHLLDTATGWPIQNDLAGVTVLASASFDGDALSTTLFALGKKDGLALAEELEGVEAVFVTREGALSCTSGLEGTLTLLE